MKKLCFFLFFGAAGKKEDDRKICSDNQTLYTLELRTLTWCWWREQGFSNVVFFFTFLFFSTKSNEPSRLRHQKKKKNGFTTSVLWDSFCGHIKFQSFYTKPLFSMAKSWGHFPLKGDLLCSTPECFYIKSRFLMFYDFLWEKWQTLVFSLLVSVTEIVISHQLCWQWKRCLLRRSKRNKKNYMLFI